MVVCLGKEKGRQRERRAEASASPWSLPGQPLLAGGKAARGGGETSQHERRMSWPKGSAAGRRRRKGTALP